METTHDISLLWPQWYEPQTRIDSQWFETSRRCSFIEINCNEAERNNTELRKDKTAELALKSVLTQRAEVGLKSH